MLQLVKTGYFPTVFLLVGSIHYVLIGSVFLLRQLLVISYQSPRHPRRDPFPAGFFVHDVDPSGVPVLALLLKIISFSHELSRGRIQPRSMWSPGWLSRFSHTIQTEGIPA